MFRRGEWRVGWLGFEGQAKSAYITILAKDSSENILLAKVTTAGQLPSAVAGYAYGCMIIVADSGVIYFNTGGATSCTFTIQGTLTAGSVVPAKMSILTAATDASTAGTGGTFSISAADAFSGLFTIAAVKTGAFTITLPAASAIQAIATFNATTGAWFDMTIINATGFTGTFLGGAGVTLVGNTTFATAKVSRVRFVNTGAGAVSAYITTSA